MIPTRLTCNGTSTFAKQNIGMIGIGGTGMQGLAYILAEQGHTVFGTDAQYENIKDRFQKTSFQLTDEDEFWKRAACCERIIYTDAVKQDSPALQKARSLTSNVEKYSDALGKLSEKYVTIAVTGTHGKSSTTAMLAHILIAANLDPTVLLGAAIPQWGNRHARVGQSKYLLLEADEYRNHFLSLHPKYAIITSIEHDHPDFFQSTDDTIKSYRQFIERVDEEGKIFTHKKLAEQYPSLSWPANTTFLEEESLDFELAIPGDHMQQNALLTLALSKELGIEDKTAKQALTDFEGLGRRFETVGQINQMKIISDYGHHPTEIKVTLQATKDKFPDQKILVIFEAHTPERLEEYGSKFAQALSLADKLIIAPTFTPSGRDNKKTAPKAALSEIIKQVSANNVKTKTLPDYSHLQQTLIENSEHYNLTICFCAGVLDQKIRAIIESNK